MHYYSYNRYLREQFGEKVRRIGLNAGFSCPNKAGEKGCIFCNELGFSEFAGETMPLKDQIEESMERFKEKDGTQKFVAYFQNATNTYAEISKLKSAYDVIRVYPEIVALSVSTRPDCMDAEKLDLIKSYTDDYDVWIEYGLQTVHDRTLEVISRGHTHAQTIEAIEKTAKEGIKVGVHVMLGLPGESKEDMIKTAKEISRLPVSGVKLHMFHVLKNTELEKLYREGKIELLKRDEYIGIVCDFLENLRSDCVILRLVSDSREEFLVAPNWINEKLPLIRQVESEFVKRGTCQGISSQ